MSNGYDPDDGKLLVPFDLRKDVIEPITRLTKQVEHTSGRIDSHITTHESEVQARIERKQKWRKRGKQVLVALGASFPFLVAALQQILSS